MILYSEDDVEAAESFKNHLVNEIKLPNEEPVRAVLYDGPELKGLSGLNFEHLDLAFERCSYTLVYLTQPFVKNTWCKIISESCLMRTIQFNKEKGWRVVPVYTERLDECLFKIPMGLKALKGINYYRNDEFYRKGVVQLIMTTRAEKKSNQERQENQHTAKAEQQSSITSQEEEATTQIYQESTDNTAVPDTQEMDKQSDIHSKEQLEQDSSQMDINVLPKAEGQSIYDTKGPLDDFDSLLFEDNGSNVPSIDQSLLTQENQWYRGPQRNGENQIQDDGKQSQKEKSNVAGTNTQNEPMQLLHISGACNSRGELALEVKREKPIAVIRPGRSTANTGIANATCETSDPISNHSNLLSAEANENSDISASNQERKKLSLTYQCYRVCRFSLTQGGIITHLISFIGRKWPT